MVAAMFPRYTCPMTSVYLRRAVLACLLFGLIQVVAAQTPQAPPAQAGPASAVPAAPNQDDLQQYVKKQFGEGFKVAPMQPRGAAGHVLEGKPPLLLLTGDLDGDGTEDAIILVYAPANVLLGEKDFSYRVIDPYDSYFGFGDPRSTRQMFTDPTRDRTLLIVHDWRAATPKAKFVIINLPFDNLSIAPATLKKKMRTAITTEEGGMAGSLVYWDGKRYRYEPGADELP